MRYKLIISNFFKRNKGSKNDALWTKRFLNIMFINVLIFFAQQLQLSTLPIYIYDLSGSNSIVGICAALGTVSSIIIRPWAGFVLDRFGRRMLLVIGVALMIITTLLYQVSPNIWSAIITRFLFGLGWGISTTSSNTIATDVIPKKRFAEGMGYFSLSQSFSLALAPAIGLALMERHGFFGLTNVAAALFGIVLIICLFLRFSIINKGEKVKFAPYERSAIRPTVITVFIGLGLGSVFGFASLYGEYKAYENVGLFFILFATALLVTRPITGKLIDRYGFNRVVFPGFVGYIVSMLLLFITDSEAGFLAAALLQGLSYGAVQTAIQTMAVINSPEHRRGAANATFFTGFDVGIGLGNIVAGFFSSAFGYNIMFGWMAILIFIGAVLYFLIARKIKINMLENHDINIEQVANDSTLIDM